MRDEAVRAVHALSTRGLLSQEAVCTENLAGLQKLLPCRDQGGLGALLSPAAILGSTFHMMELNATIDRASGALRLFDGN